MRVQTAKSETYCTLDICRLRLQGLTLTEPWTHVRGASRLPSIAPSPRSVRCHACNANVFGRPGWRLALFAAACSCACCVQTGAILMEVHLKSTPRTRRSRLQTSREHSRLIPTCVSTMDRLIAKLPHDTALAIYRDAVLMHMWQRQCEHVWTWAGPVFSTWAKIMYYERQWPGSTEASAAVAWEDDACCSQELSWSEGLRDAAPACAVTSVVLRLGGFSHDHSAANSPTQCYRLLPSCLEVLLLPLTAAPTRPAAV